MSLTLNEIRKRYLKYMRSNGHVMTLSSSLVPENDPTTLFTGSGMQPMIQYFMGAMHPSGKRITNSQKCFRAQDIEEVGDNRHTVFFEMLGNWSLGDYFKKEQISAMYKFLTDKEIGLGIDKNRLYFSCYQGNESLNIKKDQESKGYWLDMGVEESHLYFYPDKKNWWSRVGVPENMPVGEPGGPDTEMFYDFDPDLSKQMHEKATNKDEICNPNCDCGRFMEIGNNVFMQFRKTESGVEELIQKNVDFGGGLERFAAAVRGDADMFNIEVFDNAKNIIEKISGQKYISDISVTFTDITNKTFAYRVILDHVRAATFLIGDGVLPGNKDQQYFVRRLIRRAVKYARNLGINQNFTKEVAESFIEYYKGSEIYLSDNLNKNKDIILNEIDKEESKFRKTLESGMKEFEKVSMINISGENAFNLLQTYGFPIELTLELAKEKNINVDIEGFEILKKEHAEKSRTASEGMFKGGLADSSEITTALHSVTHIMLAGMRKVLGESIHQAGSNINAERLRFDFNFDRKIEEYEVREIENYVNNAIQNGFEVITEEMPKQKAKEEGVEGSFWEKYPDTVMVWTMKSVNNEDIYSKELCGGPHVKNSNDYLKDKTFKIAKQEAVSAGVRRVKGVLV